MSHPLEEIRSPAESGHWERGEAVRASLLTASTPVITYALLAANIGVFLLDNSGIPIKGKFLGDLLTLRPGDVVEGGWRWARLLTCCFVHGGALHIFMNMYGLYALGPLLERMWGRWRFLALYLIAGLGGSCLDAALMLLRGDFHPLVGASGALWGGMASLAAWVFLNRDYLPRQLLRSWASNLLVVFAINVGISFIPGISAAAHFGGGAAGLVCAFLLHGQRYGGFATRAASVLALAALPVLFVMALAAARERTPAAKEQAGQIREKEDRNDLNDVLPEVQRLEKVPLKTYEEDVEGLLGKHPERRDPDKAAAAVAALEEARAELDKAVALLERSGPYADERAEQARRMRLDLVRARLDLFAFSAEILKENRNATGEVATKLGKLSERVTTLDKAYRALLIHKPGKTVRFARS